MANSCTPYETGNLAILGVIHRDREGAPLLARWLEKWRPEAVTLEFSSYGLHYRQTEGRKVKERARYVALQMMSEGKHVNQAALDGVFAFLEEPFEFTVASAYATPRGLPLFLIDGDVYSRLKLGDAEELVSPDNLATLLSGPTPEGSELQKALARLSLSYGLGVIPYTEEMAVRDREIRDRIAALMEAHSGARFLHICGWQHLLDPFDLYSSLNPSKAFIYDEALCL
jgi:hypothetical protein